MITKMICMLFTVLIEIALMIKLSVIEEYFKNIEFTDLVGILDSVFLGGGLK